ncbi:integral membrane protein [Moniliophthora roreri]|nr:integral membrane protein [Moniliophthora roreri]
MRRVFGYSGRGRSRRSWLLVIQISTVGWGNAGSVQERSICCRQLSSY